MPQLFENAKIGAVLAICLCACRHSPAQPTEDASTTVVVDAASPVDFLIVAPGVEEGYVRADWHHWIDLDGDCQDARQEVLIAESEEPVVFETAEQCDVLSGLWTCPLTGEVFTDPHELDVDHHVPLKHAHSSGGYAWTQDKRESYANWLESPEHLVAVKSSANRSKGARGPDEWLPEVGVCDYLENWITVKVEWELTVTSAELAALKNVECRSDASESD